MTVPTLNSEPLYTPFDPGFGIYVHWPFCLAKCPYCDFNSHVRRQGIDASGFTSGLIKELKSFYELIGGRTVTSIFFGGGTPSLMAPENVGQLIDTIEDLWGISGDAEVSLEANPTSSESCNFSGYKLAGINRLSIGMQALDDRSLRALGRQHSVKEALAAYRFATTIFERTSFDLIYARPEQSLKDWRHELSIALQEQQGHMSLYQLTIEPGTGFELLHKKGKLAMPDDDLAADFYDVTLELTDKFGLPAYEISNHATSGNESRHNELYWKYGEYVGVGAGAHSRLLTDKGRRALGNEANPEKWLAAIRSCGSATVEQEDLSATDQAREFLLMGLRLRQGISLGRYEQLFGQSIDQTRIDELCQQGLLKFDTASRQVSASKTGMRVLNGLIAHLAD